MDGVRRQFVDCSSGQLHLRTSGVNSQKPGIVCLHLMPKSGRVFAPLLPELADGRLVLAPDYPGYGESDPYPQGTPPTVYDYAGSICELIDHFELDRYCLVGYHTGSMVAAEIALRRPDQVAKLVLISAPVFTASEVSEFRSYFAPIPLDAAGTRYRVMWERIQEHRGPGMTLEMAADSMAENLRGGERYEQGHEAAFAHAEAFASTLEQLRQPVLVMNVGDDLFEQTQRVDAHLVDGRRVDCPHWGHGFLELRPREVAAMVLGFLDS